MAIKQIPLRVVQPEEKPEFLKHVCPPTFGGEPPDPVPPTVRLARDLLVGFDLQLPDGTSLPLWIIEDPDDKDGGRVYPSKAIRVTQDSVVHVRVGAKTNAHTIHWHGIEPSPVHDGVGKHSFEVTGNFTYQWQPRQAGTYFFHCHKNTTLHFIMGLYGLLIIDPPQGPGFVAGLNPPENVIRYDVEAFWVSTEFDPRWNNQLKSDHDAFMQKCDANNPVAPNLFTQNGFLNAFRPSIFAVTGVPRVADNIPITDPRVAINARVGDTVLVRILDAGYTVQQYTIGVDAEVIAMDGHPLGVPPNGKYSRPFNVKANTPFRLTSARRWDLIIKPTKRGTFPVRTDFLDWINGKRYGTARTVINVT